MMEWKTHYCFCKRVAVEPDSHRSCGGHHHRFGDAKSGDFVNIGLIPDLGGFYTLPLRIGFQKQRN